MSKLPESEAAAIRQARSRVFSVTGRTSVEIRRLSVANSVVESPKVIHISNYRRRRRQKVGGPVFNLEAGIVQKRSYTNVLSVVSFIIYAGLMIYIATRSWSKGNPKSMLHGMDSWGNTCGSHNLPIPNVNLSGKDFTEAGKVFFLNPRRKGESRRICICVPHCLENNIDNVQQLSAYYLRSGIKLCRYDILVDDYSKRYRKDGKKSIDDVSCPDLPRTVGKSVFHRCVDLASSSGFNGTEAAHEEEEEEVHEIDEERCHADILMAVAVDIHSNKYDLLLLSFVSVILASCMLLLMGYAVRGVVWTIYAGSMAVACATVICCWLYYIRFTYQNFRVKKIEAHSTGHVWTDGVKWLILAIAATILTVLLLILLILRRKNVKALILLFEEAASAIRQMPMLLLQPIWTLVTMLLIIGAFLWAFLYLQTTYTFKVLKNGTVKPERDLVLYWMQFFYILGIMWIMPLIFACEKFVVAGAVAEWYFTREKKHIISTVGRAGRRMMIHHIGTAILGSILITISFIPRTIIGFFNNRFLHRAGKCASCFRCCCCSRFYFSRLRFISDDAYVMTALYGSAFWEGCLKAFSVSVSAVSYLQTIKLFGFFIMFLGRLTTALLQFIVSVVVISRNGDTCYFIAPLAISTLAALVIAHCFLSVYEVALQTIFLCFCEDISQNDGVVKPYFMSDRLSEFLSEDEFYPLAKNPKEQPSTKT